MARNDAVEVQLCSRDAAGCSKAVSAPTDKVVLGQRLTVVVR